MFAPVQSKSVIESGHIMKENFRKGTVYSLKKKSFVFFSFTQLPCPKISNNQHFADSQISSICEENLKAEAVCTTGSNAFTEGKGRLDIKGKFFIT